MYKKLNNYIVDFALESDGGDYWYDCAIVEAMGILKQFNKNDWEELLKQLKFKSIFWKKRLIECLGDFHNQYELKIIIDVSNTDDKDLFITCIDSLRSLDLSNLEKIYKEKLLNNSEKLLNQNSTSIPSNLILNEFIKKLKIE